MGILLRSIWRGRGGGRVELGGFWAVLAAAGDEASRAVICGGARMFRERVGGLSCA